MMIVATSWVTFWLQADQTAPRAVLGCSTMLSFITLATSHGKSLAKVSYVKASEIWFLGCVGFIFASLMEFAFVNIIWRRRKNVELKKVNAANVIKSTLTPRLARKELNNATANKAQTWGHYTPPDGNIKKAGSGNGLDNYLSVGSNESVSASNKFLKSRILRTFFFCSSCLTSLAFLLSQLTKSQRVGMMAQTVARR